VAADAAGSRLFCHFGGVARSGGHRHRVAPQVSLGVRWRCWPPIGG